jgi:hypothetical protein
MIDQSEMETNQNKNRWRELGLLAAGCFGMQDPRYYRDEAARARRLSGTINHPEARAMLLKLAKDYEEIAVDLERGPSKSSIPSLCRSRTR